MNIIIDIQRDIIFKESTLEKVASKYQLEKKDILNLLKHFNWNKGSGNYKRPDIPKKSKYVINSSYFETIDSQEKAYILGFLYADGSNREVSSKISILLQYRDKEILERILNEMNGTHPIKKVSILQKKGICEYSKITICDKYMSRCLAEKGCFENKTNLLRFPTEEQVPSYLLQHFIRGYFDGDGCFYYDSKRNKFEISIASSISFVKEMQIRLNQILDIPIRNLKFSKVAPYTGIYRFSGRLQFLKFRDWLYKDATIYLQRKYDKCFYYNTIF